MAVVSGEITHLLPFYPPLHGYLVVEMNIVRFPSHTSHGLQPLDTLCFKPFK